MAEITDVKMTILAEKMDKLERRLDEHDTAQRDFIRTEWPNIIRLSEKIDALKDGLSFRTQALNDEVIELKRKDVELEASINTLSSKVSDLSEKFAVTRGKLAILASIVLGTAAVGGGAGAIAIKALFGIQ